jgi:hypothetical protein
MGNYIGLFLHHNAFCNNVCHWCKCVRYQNIILRIIECMFVNNLIPTIGDRPKHPFRIHIRNLINRT